MSDKRVWFVAVRFERLVELLFVDGQAVDPGPRDPNEWHELHDEDPPTGLVRIKGVRLSDPEDEDSDFDPEITLSIEELWRCRARRGLTRRAWLPPRCVQLPRALPRYRSALGLRPHRPPRRAISPPPARGRRQQRARWTDRPGRGAQGVSRMDRQPASIELTAIPQPGFGGITRGCERPAAGGHSGRSMDVASRGSASSPTAPWLGAPTPVASRRNDLCRKPPNEREAVPSTAKPKNRVNQLVDDLVDRELELALGPDKCDLVERACERVGSQAQRGVVRPGPDATSPNAAPASSSTVAKLS
jgi:hypothetical protein